MIKRIALSFLVLCFCLEFYSQEGSKMPEQQQYLSDLVSKYKKDVRGPYKRLNWYCNDGRINPAKEPCGDEIGGFQRASYKDEVVRLGEEKHIYLGAIFTTRCHTPDNYSTVAMGRSPNNSFLDNQGVWAPLVSSLT